MHPNGLGNCLSTITSHVSSHPLFSPSTTGLPFHPRSLGYSTSVGDERCPAMQAKPPRTPKISTPREPLWPDTLPNIPNIVLTAAPRARTRGAIVCSARPAKPSRSCRPPLCASSASRPLSLPSLPAPPPTNLPLTLASRRIRASPLPSALLSRPPHPASSGNRRRRSDPGPDVASSRLHTWPPYPRTPPHASSCHSPPSLAATRRWAIPSSPTSTNGWPLTGPRPSTYRLLHGALLRPTAHTPPSAPGKPYPVHLEAPLPALPRVPTLPRRCDWLGARFGHGHAAT